MSKNNIGTSSRSSSTIMMKNVLKEIMLIQRQVKLFSVIFQIFVSMVSIISFKMSEMQMKFRAYLQGQLKRVGQDAHCTCVHPKKYLRHHTLTTVVDKLWKKIFPPPKKFPKFYPSPLGPLSTIIFSTPHLNFWAHFP